MEIVRFVSNLSFLSKMDPKFDTKRLKKVLFQVVTPCFYHFYLSFLSFEMAIIEPFLSSLNKSSSISRSKRYSPFLYIRRILPQMELFSLIWYRHGYWYEQIIWLYEE